MNVHNYISQMYINGQWVNATDGSTFDVLNPSNGDKIGKVANGDRSDAQKAIQAARHAFDPWSRLTAYQRSEYLYKAYQLMMEHRKHLARVMTEEQGKPLKASRGEIQYGADFLLWYAEEAKRIYGETIPAPRSDQRFIVMRQPVGVVAAITPWNYPMSMITRKVAPALAAGCTVVLKPAEATPLCAVEIFKIFEKAGIPAGVVNLVTAWDPVPIGETFITSPFVRKITFTGSTEVGKILAKKAAEQVKHVSLELGGHAPFIVFDDADPVYAAMLVKFLNTGQACISPNRIFVHRSIVDPFIEEFKNRVSGMRAGSGFEQGVSIGPLVNSAALEKVSRQVADALDKGATLVCGGHRMMDNNLDKGYFYAPTVLKDVTPEMLIYRQETFGPVAPIIFGIIGINDINPTAAAAPFGGMKESGLGREGGREGIAEYLETKLGGFSV
jgi:succinate-semialdehyde dehydrogenase/glutarate-semialdehyde dehydrogenase